MWELVQVKECQTESKRRPWQAAIKWIGGICSWSEEQLETHQETLRDSFLYW